MDRLEQRPFVRVRRQQKLPGREAAVGLKRAAADEERQRPRSAIQSSRLEIEKDERSARARREESSRRRRVVEARGVRPDRLASVMRFRRPATFDDVASSLGLPFTAE